MSSKCMKVGAGCSAVVSSSGFVSHEEAAKRIAALTDAITTKKEARKLLRKLGILNKKNKLVKALA